MSEKLTISRRTLTKGIAWSVPAVAVTTATPAFAVSGQPPVVQVLDACKQPGNSCNSGSKSFGFVKGYTFTVKLYNPSGETIYLYSDTTPTDLLYAPVFTVTSSVPFTYSSARYFTPGLVGTAGIGAPVGDLITLAPGETKYIIVSAGTNSNSANTDAVGTLFYAWGHTQTAGADLQHPYTPKPTSEGWIGGSFSFPSTPPCGTDCVPGGDESLAL